jgi:peptide/nickel transport system substrate-binding protein
MGTVAERKAIYEQAAPAILAGGSVMYLYHRTLLFAHSNRLEGFRVYPDGLIRVTGLRLK